LPEAGLQPLMGPLLISAHEARIARDIGGEDGSEAADSRPRSPGGQFGLTKCTVKPVPALASSGPNGLERGSQAFLTRFLWEHDPLYSPPVERAAYWQADRAHMERGAGRTPSA